MLVISGRRLYIAGSEARFGAPPRTRRVNPRSLPIPRHITGLTMTTHYRAYLENFLKENLPDEWICLNRRNEAPLDKPSYMVRWVGTDLDESNRMIDTVDVIVLGIAALENNPDDSVRSYLETMFETIWEDNCTLIGPISVDEGYTIEGDQFQYMTATISCISALDVRGAFE